MRSDEELISQIREKNDEGAFYDLYKRYKKLAFSCAGKYVLPSINDPTMVDDVCVDAWEKVWRNIRKYNPRYEFSTWLYEIVKNTSFDHLERLKRVQEPAKPKNDTIDNSKDQDQHVSVIEHKASTAPNAAQVMTAKEIAASVVNIMSTTLTQRKYEILRLKFLGWKREDIAATLKTTINTVDSSQSQAIAQLKPKIAEELNFSSVAEALDECIKHLIEILSTENQ